MPAPHSQPPSSRRSTVAPPRGGNNSVNNEKFATPQSPFSPDLIPVWKNALESLKSQYPTIQVVMHENRDLLRGYFFPDPFMFLKNGSELRNASRYLVAWSYIRLDWLSRVTGLNSSEEKLKIPQPQHWRQMLYLVGKARGLFPPPVASSSASKKPKKRKVAPSNSAPPAESSGVDGKDRKAEVNDAIAVLLKDIDTTEGLPHSLTWGGAQILTRRQLIELNGVFDIPPLVGRQMVWELFENNFRLELLALDRCVRPRLGMDAAAAVALEDEVVQVYPSTVWMVARLPTFHEGLGALELMDRVVYVERFRKLLSSWPGREAAELRALSTFEITGGSKTYSPLNVARIEEIAVSFYCQTFFQYFSRAPCSPYQLPL